MSDIFPPHDLGAERAVLAGMMLSGEAAIEGASTLKRDMFYSEAHAILFGCFKYMIEKSLPLDAVVIKAQLEKHKRLDAIGGMDFLLELYNNVAAGANIASYCAIVADKHNRRQLQTTLEGSLRDVHDDSISTADLLNKAEQGVFEVVTGAASEGGTRTIGEIGKEILEDIPKRMQSKSSIVGISTGYPSLDKDLLGFQGGQLYIIAARPSIGKSTLGVVNMPYKVVAETPGTPAYIFSLEMTAKNLVTNMLCMVSGVDSVSIRTGKNTEEQFGVMLKEFGDQMYDLGIHVNDKPWLKPSDIRIEAKRLVRKYGKGPVFIDYLQYMQPEKSNMDDRAKVGYCSRAMKALSKDLDVPVILLSQLNRNPEERKNHTPLLSDLRESGAIEQDADVVMLLNRPEYYGEEPKGRLSVHNAKNRNGPTGKVNLPCEIDKFIIGDYNQ